MNERYRIFVGDDTGLLKNVRLYYNYQTDIVGSYMAVKQKTEDEAPQNPDDSDQDYEELKAKKNEKAQKSKEDELYSQKTLFDKDG